MTYPVNTDKNAKVKFTTNLTVDCLKNIDELSHIIKVKNRNEVIEFLVEKEMSKHEMDKKRNSRRNH